MTSPLLLSIGAVFLVIGSSWVTGRVRTFGLIDHPNERSSHAVPIPRAGGIAIALLSLVAFISSGSLTNALPPHILVGYTVAGAVISAVSLLDDIRSLGVFLRLGAQVLVATVVVVSSGVVSGLQFAQHSFGPGIADAIGIVIWTVGLTNIYNFMDGIDGIAGTQAVIAGIGWAILGLLERETGFVLLGTAIAASSLGFLRHNWAPASIFMGDVGSTFLGFSFAVLPLLSAARALDFAVPAALFVWPFLFDGVFTLLRRLVRGENIFKAHRSHLYQRLNIAGYPHGWISTLFGALAVEGMICAIAFVRGGAATRTAVAVLIVATAVLLWRFVLRAERHRAATAPA